MNRTKSPSRGLLLVLGPFLVGVLALGMLCAASQPASHHRQEILLAGRTNPQTPLPPLLDPHAVEANFVQVYPPSGRELTFQRRRDQSKAVVLIHGFTVHPHHNKAVPHSWQQPGSHLAQVLSTLADVFAFTYSQTVGIEEIAGVPALADNIRRLKGLGYREVVLLGHSAGGLVARQFVEDCPEAGVTKVIQVCTPNGGTSTAHLDLGVSKPQKVFLQSLTKEARTHFLTERARIKVPEGLEFVCLVGVGAGVGDGVVSVQSQWPPDLQAQGIPAFPCRTTHFTVMRSPAVAFRLAELVRDPNPRWPPARVALVRKELWGR